MKKHILLGVTASIAAYKACEIITGLKKDGFEVTVCLSRDGRHFITPLTLQTLSGARVFCDMFEEIENYDPVHITLAQRSSVFLIAPATADCISKIACGICDDIITATAVSTKAPVLIAPAMNENMYNNKIIQENIEKLKNKGVKFIGPKKGRLACGEEGMGHIADTDEIIKQVKKAAK